jgi:RNA methyltransferase, TrmH family
MITSTHNPKIQWVRSLNARSAERREAQVFVAEGVRLAEEAYRAGWRAELVLHTTNLEPRGQAVVRRLAERGAPVELVSEQVMRAASDTQTPQGLLVVLSMQTLSPPDEPDFIFIPDGVRDPGNLGTMLRTAAAASVSLLCLTPGTVDVFSPKVVRAGMGAHFHLPVFSGSWDEIASLLSNFETKTYLAAAGEGISYLDADFSGKVALVIGGEAAGAGAYARTLAHETVHIPMPGGMESLNAAAAAAILMFEVLRQRGVR